MAAVSPDSDASGIAPEHPLAQAVGHCAHAEKAADQGRWDAANAEVGAVHGVLQRLVESGAFHDFEHRELHLLTKIDGRIKRLQARAAAARESTAHTLCGMRKQRNAAAAYRQHG